MIKQGDYYLVDGHRYPSVTSILRVLPKPALVNWAAREVARAILEAPERRWTVEEAASVPFRQRNQAGARGKDVHSAVEVWSRGGRVEEAYVAPEGEPYREGLLTWIRAHGPRPLHGELVVVNDTHRYAGTTDMLVELGGVVWVVDAKTSKAVYYEYHLQTCAYAHAERALVDGKWVPMPKVSRTGVLLLPGDGTYSFTETRGDFETFLAAKELWERLRDKDVI